MIALVAAAGVGSAPAGAATPTGPGITVGPDSVVVDAADRGEVVRVVAEPERVSSARTLHCVFLDVPSIGAPVDSLWIPRRPVDAMLYQLWCWRGGDSSTAVAGTPRLVVYDRRDPVPGLVDAWDLAREASRRLSLPTPRLALSPAGDQLVGVDTWLALTSPIRLDPVTTSVTLQAGAVWSTAIPRFSHVEWDLGDGTRLRCTTDIDRVFDPARPEAPPPACRHVYTTAAATRVVTARPVWTVDWRSSADPVARPYGSVSRAASVTVAVIELQSLIR